MSAAGTTRKVLDLPMRFRAVQLTGLWLIVIYFPQADM